MEDPVPIQSRQGIQPAGLGGQLGQLRPQPLGPGDVFDAKIERIAKSPRGGIVRAGPLRHDGGGRTERIDEHHAGPQSGRPLGQPPQVGQVADAPALPRPRAVKLHGPAPARLAGFDAPPGRDDDPRPPIAGRGIEVVIAQRQDRPGASRRRAAASRPPGRVVPAWARARPCRHGSRGPPRVPAARDWPRGRPWHPGSPRGYRRGSPPSGNRVRGRRRRPRRDVRHARQIAYGAFGSGMDQIWSAARCQQRSAVLDRGLPIDID